MSIWMTTAIVLATGFLGCGVKNIEIERIPEEEKEETSAVTLLITYDNNPYDGRLRASWGFSCAVRLAKRTILFDTGGDGRILLSNMERLGVDPGEIDTVFLSHVHGDHTGGLASFLERNSDVTIYMPFSFPRELKAEAKLQGARVEEVQYAEEIAPGVFTTGELDGRIKEQSLVLRTPRGLVVITGCAHPGIVNIVQEAKKFGKDNVHLVLGGFHLGGASATQITSIIEDFEELGVEKVAPCHCSGDQARSLFKEHFGLNYIECGVGKRIRIPE